MIVENLGKATVFIMLNGTVIELAPGDTYPDINPDSKVSCDPGESSEIRVVGTRISDDEPFTDPVAQSANWKPPIDLLGEK